jgi:hypothetical protein
MTDPLLLLVVVGVIALALVVGIGACVAWLRRRWQRRPR